eukprot:TRINITY_DN12087_c0_g1_i2.p1 TRINITY_DN12087_c0_g1~~TRINITY_DN12087_c0_g1_i2.p1  ORF type:complete len:479 (+),score=124.36 TRINITY_DN12087_c0_g1_i2:81-1517(+)
MVRTLPKHELENRLRQLGESPEFKENEKQAGHFRYHCVKRNAIVNFWEGKSSWNAQGRDAEQLIRELEEARFGGRRSAVPPPAIAAGGSPGPAALHSASLAAVAVTTAAPEIAQGVVQVPQKARETPPAHAQTVSAPSAGSPSSTKNTRPLEALQQNFLASVDQSVALAYVQWGHEKASLMKLTYDKFCHDRHMKFVDSSREKGQLVPGGATEEFSSFVSRWFTEEKTELKAAYQKWAAEEDEKLTEAFEGFKQQFRGIFQAELLRVRGALETEARQQVEAWKEQERQTLFAEAQRATVLAEASKQALVEQLRSAEQAERAARQRQAAAERECEAQRKRAEKAEAALKQEQINNAARAKKRPALSSRLDFLTKRVRLQHDPRLAPFGGSLCDKINSALDAGKITRALADRMHQVRQRGNDAAHEAEGSFGTQVPKTSATFEFSQPVNISQPRMPPIWSKEDEDDYNSDDDWDDDEIRW